MTKKKRKIKIPRNEPLFNEVLGNRQTPDLAKDILGDVADSNFISVELSCMETARF